MDLLGKGELLLGILVVVAFARGSLAMKEDVLGVLEALGLESVIKIPNPQSFSLFVLNSLIHVVIKGWLVHIFHFVIHSLHVRLIFSLRIPVCRGILSRMLPNLWQPVVLLPHRLPLDPLDISLKSVLHFQDLNGLELSPIIDPLVHLPIMDPFRSPLATQNFIDNHLSFDFLAQEVGYTGVPCLFVI